MLVTGGKAIYGAAVGVLMLEARFPRIPGDMGNASSWPFPVHYRIVRGATPDRVVNRRAEGLAPAFVAAARELVVDGVDGITTNCGFLSLFQAELAAAAEVPVAASSLMQVATVARLLPPGRRVGVLTISAASLSAEHLEAAGVPPGTPVGGVDPDGAFARAILWDALALDVDAARAENVAAARALVDAHPDIGALVLECTNMTPYARDVRAATGVPVFSMDGFIRWFQSGLEPRAFPPPEPR